MTPIAYTTSSGNCAIKKEVPDDKKPSERKDIHKESFYVGGGYPPEAKRLMVTVWVPPQDVSYQKKTGRWVFGVPVWNSETAESALRNFKATIDEFLYGRNYDASIDVEKLFQMADVVTPLLEMLKETKQQQ